MDVIVPDDQLSLAIGRRGQNVRLAVQLTGWRIDMKSESKMRDIARWLSEAVSVVEGCGEPEGDLLLQQGITSLEDLVDCQLDLLTSLPGIDEAGAAAICARAAELVVQKQEEEEEARLAAEQAERDAAEQAERDAAEAAEQAELEAAEEASAEAAAAVDETTTEDVPESPAAERQES